VTILKLNKLQLQILSTLAELKTTWTKCTHRSRCFIIAPIPPLPPLPPLRYQFNSLVTRTNLSGHNMKVILITTLLTSKFISMIKNVKDIVLKRKLARLFLKNNNKTSWSIKQEFSFLFFKISYLFKNEIIFTQ
jgi:hypothetical protein